MLELPPPRLGSRSDPSALDLRSQFLFLKSPPNDLDDVLAPNLAWHMKRVHEGGHWIRFHGSTIGLALTLLRATRDLTATMVLKELDPGTKRGLGDLRRQGHRLFSFDGAEGLANALGTEIAVWAQIWLDLLYTYYALFESTTIEAKAWSATEAVQGGLADMWLHYAEFGRCLPYPGNDGARSAVVGDVFFGRASGKPLTTRLLFECASVVDELTQTASSPAQLRPDLMQMTVTALTETSYGVPFQAACEIAGRTLSPSTVCALIDFALNPPVPGLDERAHSVSWPELYPPARFTLAAKGLRSGDEVDVMPGTDELLAFRSELTERTELRYGTVSVQLSERDSLTEAMLTANPDWVDAMLYVCSRLLPLRTEEPALVSHFGTAWYGSGATRMIDPEEWNDALVPFIEIVDGKFKWQPILGREHASDFLFSVAVAAAIDDVVNGVGPVTVDHLPDDFSASRRDWIAEQIGLQTGITPS